MKKLAAWKLGSRRQAQAGSQTRFFQQEYKKTILDTQPGSQAAGTGASPPTGAVATKAQRCPARSWRSLAQPGLARLIHIHLLDGAPSLTRN